MTDPRVDALVNQVAALERRMMVLRDWSAWTPRWEGTTGAGTFTYTQQQGRWWEHGLKIEFIGRILISAITGAPTGNMLIKGLPYPSAGVTNMHAGGCWFDYISQFNYAANSISLQGRINPSEDYVRLSEAFDNAAAVEAPAANFTNAACDIWFQGWYLR